MELDELKEKARFKVLLIGPSGRGKTYVASGVALEVLESGRTVLYADTEAEGSSTIVQRIEEEEYSEDVVSGLEYRQVENLEQWNKVFEDAGDYDLVVFDTLDHKHSYVLKAVTDAKTKADADWNQYPQIYSNEKELMERIGKPPTNILATIDPESGKSDKPKGAQTNVSGYFTAVVQLSKNGDDWTNKVLNWVGRRDLIGNALPDPESNIAETIKEYS